MHDCPAQDLSLSILKLDSIIGKLEKNNASEIKTRMINELNEIESSMQNALKEMRAIATGLVLPQLNRLDLIDTISHVVHKHEQQTNTIVQLEFVGEIIKTSLPIRITVYRVIQEALHNSYFHAKGAEQRVLVKFENEHILLEISDSGPGFNVKKHGENSERLGVTGMRERIESIGGVFEIESFHDQGTVIRANLPNDVVGENDE
mgnify:CR=1 FL=1